MDKERIHHLRTEARVMPRHMGFPDQANVKSVDFQLLLGADRRIIRASFFVARFKIIAILILGQDLEGELIINNPQHDLSDRG